MKSAQPKGTVAVLNDTSWVPHHGCKIVSGVLRAELVAAGYEVRRLPIGRDWERKRAKIFTCDGVIINGEGTFHKSSPVAKRLLKIVPELNNLDIPVFLINSVWEDNDPEMIELARRLDGIFVRESESEAELKKFGLSSTVVPDLTLRLAQYGIPQSSSNNRTEHQAVYFDSVNKITSSQILSAYHAQESGLLLSMTPANDDEETYNFGLLNKDTNAALIKTLDKRNSILSMLPRLAVSFVRKLIDLFRWDVYLSRYRPQKLELSELFTTLRSSEMVISGRFHAICMSMLANVPFVASATNSHKIYGLLKDSGLSNRYLDVLPPNGFGAALPEWQTSDTANVQKYVRSALERQDKMFHDIFLTLARKTNRR